MIILPSSLTIGCSRLPSNIATWHINIESQVRLVQSEPKLFVTCNRPHSRPRIYFSFSKVTACARPTRNPKIYSPCSLTAALFQLGPTSAGFR